MNARVEPRIDHAAEFARAKRVSLPKASSGREPIEPVHVSPQRPAITCGARAVRRTGVLCDTQGLDACHVIFDRLCRVPEIDRSLSVQPELRRVAEQAGEA